MKKANGRNRTDNRRFTKPGLNNPNYLENKTLTDFRPGNYDASLTNLIQEHPELEEVVERWPALPEHVRQAILCLVK
jgi:hypothetical protein